MHLADLTQVLADMIQASAGTVAERAKGLRRAGMLTTGKQGRFAGAHMTNADATNLLLASLIDHRRGEDVAANVQRFRALPHKESERLIFRRDFTAGLTFVNAIDAGNAVDRVFDDFRAGRFDEWSAAHPQAHLTVSIHQAAEQVWVALNQPASATEDGLPHAAFVVCKIGPDSAPPLIERQIVIDGKVLERIAMALGPIGNRKELAA